MWFAQIRNVEAESAKSAGFEETKKNTYECKQC